MCNWEFWASGNWTVEHHFFTGKTIQPNRQIHIGILWYSEIVRKLATYNLLSNFPECLVWSLDTWSI
jgi:hypothetical protein